MKGFKAFDGQYLEGGVIEWRVDVNIWQEK